MKALICILFLLSHGVFAQDNSMDLSIDMSIKMNVENELEKTEDVQVQFDTEEVNESDPFHEDQKTESSQNKIAENIIYVNDYEGGIGCTPPVSDEKLNRMITSISNQSFEDGKVRVAKQIVRSNCITVEQLMKLLEEFNFDEGKLEVSKFSFDHTYDIDNYFMVYDVFSFSSSGEELEEYILSK